MTETPSSPVRIKDSGMKSEVVIYGHRIGFGTSQNDESISWAEIEIYANDDTTYTVHRAGYSYIYHRADTRCTTREGRKRGSPASVDDLPDEAVPCPVCAPPYPDELPEGKGTIRFEFPRHAFSQCENQRHCFAKLTKVRQHDGTHTVQVSRPVMDAIRSAALLDPGFALIWDELDNPEPAVFGRAAAG